MDLRPLHDRLIVLREVAPEKVGNLFIPDAAQKKLNRGTVVAAGEGARTPNGARIPMDVKVGDVIVFGPYTGNEITHDGETYVFLQEKEVFAVVGAK